MTTKSQDVRHAIAQRLADGYAELAAAPDGKRRRRLAATHRPDERMERLLRLRETDPVAFGRLDPATKMGVGYYESSAKAAHDEEEATR